jgi:hypothetical protein
MKKITKESDLKGKLIELYAWYGVIAILAAYMLTTLGILPSSNKMVLLLNITGSGGILIDALKSKNYQPVVLNAIWLIIAVIAIVR